HAKLFFYKENTYFREVLSESEQAIFVQELQKILQEVGASTIMELDTPLVVKEMMCSILQNGWPLQFETAEKQDIPLVTVKENYRIGKTVAIELLLEEADIHDVKWVARTSFKEMPARLVKRKENQTIWDVVVREKGTVEKAVFKLKPYQTKARLFYQDEEKDTPIADINIISSILGKLKRNRALKRKFKQGGVS
ncbi:TPA: glycosyltransferase family 2 protein, partial [Listeria monocytogenes]|nr:glycosyltransferase family 2 protein [Listeria monocytogenes]